ncbi:uncharacterized protein LOC125608656 [Brassica napus]|uniref:uncharacterized protein LOC125608656 n=1 Tax=Brassica napus TaxID=3708 RepID=UPI002078BD19|nr:uncharacterized protein LOC125608656 [Brassica napus]
MSSAAANPQFLDHYENPYYLHSSDHAGLVLVSDRLSSGAEFHSWKRSIRMALNVRNKLGFIDGTIPKPLDSHRDAGSWSRCNDMVTTWIMNSVSKKIAQSLLYMPAAESIWKNLLVRFKQDDAPRVYEIEQRLGSIQQGSMDVTTYYTELVTLWEEYKNFIDLPVCTCGRCECNAASLWEKLQERSRVMKFLMGLNESYDASRRQILMMKPIPSLEDVFNMITQDERQKSIKPAVKSDAVIFQTMGSPSESVPTDAPVLAAAQHGYRPKQRPLCTYCGQYGHILQKCFKIHGYPPGHRFHGQTPRGSSSQSMAARGQQNQSGYPRSHQQHQPLQYPPSNTVANVTNVPLMGSSIPSSSSLDVNRMSQDQVQYILHQLQASVRPPESSVQNQHATITEHGHMAAQSSSGIILSLSSNLRFENNILTFNHHCLSSLYNALPSGSWIIDSGATTHVCSDLARFSDLSTVTGVTVSLPNGHKEPISHIGSIIVSPTITLHNVLYVPSFRFNLISVRCLLVDNNSSAHFYVDHCLIQESTEGLMIGRGSIFNNLYVLDTNVSASPTICASLLDDGQLWHQRLGHASLAKLLHVPGIKALHKTSLSAVENCPVCPLAKQRRLPFVFHNHISSFPFDLVHMDVWGPFSVESTEGYRYFLTLVDDCTRVTWIYFLKNKSDVSKVFPAFIQHVHLQYKANIKSIRTDNAPELAFTDLVCKHGMIHQFSCAYTPQQNSVVERKHQHILNVARALLFQSKLPLIYWTDCVSTAVFLINRTRVLKRGRLAD